MSYLSKLVDFCEQENIKLILVNFPKYHKDKHYQCYSYHFDETRKLYFQQVDYLDFSRMYDDKSYFSDMIHLSHKGSQEFSRFLNTNSLKTLLNSNFNKK